MLGLQLGMHQALQNAAVGVGKHMISKKVEMQNTCDGQANPISLAAKLSFNPRCSKLPANQNVFLEDRKINCAIRPDSHPSFASA